MLRLYKPIEDDEIFKLHKTLENLVCDVWCTANENSAESKMNADLKNIMGYSYKTGITFKDEIERIYLVFKTVDDEQRAKIVEAFEQADLIEELCEKTIQPIMLGALHDCVENDIKPLFKWCYEDLLDKKKVGGDKLKYYKSLIKKNKFNYCPCCGLIDFEDEDDENEVREAYDHYLPKSAFPFASVNFKNLVPLCYKCNSDRKRAKNPIEGARIAYYPFSETPLTHNIGILTSFEFDLDEENNLAIDEIEFNFTDNDQKIDTWNWLFDIKSRYASKVTKNSKTFLRELKSRYKSKLKSDSSATYEDLLNEEIELYSKDIYDDWKFLKIPVIENLLNTNELMQVYANNNNV